VEGVKIEDKLGYEFEKKELLDRALTRKAYALELKQQGQECEDQEVFRTLGDAVLKAILVDLLIQSGCSTREEITKKKEGLEREERLAEVGRDLGIGKFISLGAGEKKQKAEEEPKVLAETFEALIGAIYRDRGYDASKEVVTRLYEGFLP
jgi:ribonuclease-3